MSTPQILILGTCDTKSEETIYIKAQLNSLFPTLGASIMDVGRSSVPNSPANFRPPEILSKYHSDTQAPPPKDLASLSRAEYIDYISLAATHYVKNLYSSSQIHGLVATGGSSGSSLCAAIMRNAVPIGFPKVLVSTMASGDISPYIDNVDITMMYSVTDIAGLNYLSRQILTNAAGAIGGMVLARSQKLDGGVGERSVSEGKDMRRPPRVGITMFGVTTPGVDAIRSLLTKQHGYEVLVFHATGSGGRAMERLCLEGGLDGVIDLTTTEIADEIVGGVLAAGPHRMEAPVSCGIPYIVSVGACDMVNFGPRSSVPEKWVEKGRKLYVHNPTVTLMRTTKDECRQIADFIVRKLKMAKEEFRENIKVVVPLGATSLIAGEGGPFEDRKADEELFRGIEDGLRGTGIEVIKDENAVNDEKFSRRIVDTFVPLMERHSNRGEWTND